MNSLPETPVLSEQLWTLFNTIDRRERPEEVARLVERAASFLPEEQVILAKASSHSGASSSMANDFFRPPSMAEQLARARTLFRYNVAIDAADMAALHDYFLQIEREIGKDFGANDFKKDRLTRLQRVAIGLDISKRQYNKRFRFLARAERKRLRVLQEQRKRAMTLASKNRLAARLAPQHLGDPNTACFIAYYVARCNKRSVFTNGSQPPAFDEVSDMLLQRCHRSVSTNWYAIAHVLPDPDVLMGVSAGDRGRLLGDYFAQMCVAAELLRAVWERSEIDRKTMVVRRGNDSTTWNVAAGAWNKLRSGWFSLLFSLGLEDWLESICPGKAMRLMAADVAAWHWRSGSDLHRDTGPWCELPLPWEILEGQTCTKSQVLESCQKWGVDAIKAGWVAPPPERKVARYAPTAELVHGIEVSCPHLASILRRLGVFSGKSKLLG